MVAYRPTHFMFRRLIWSLCMRVRWDVNIISSFPPHEHCVHGSASYGHVLITARGRLFATKKARTLRSAMWGVIKVSQCVVIILFYYFIFFCAHSENVVSEIGYWSGCIYKALGLKHHFPWLIACSGSTRWQVQLDARAHHLIAKKRCAYIENGLAGYGILPWLAGQSSCSFWDEGLGYIPWQCPIGKALKTGDQNYISPLRSMNCQQGCSIAANPLQSPSSRSFKCVTTVYNCVKLMAQRFESYPSTGSFLLRPAEAKHIQAST